jgi:hypothetical protein
MAPGRGLPLQPVAGLGPLARPAPPDPAATAARPLVVLIQELTPGLVDATVIVQFAGGVEPLALTLDGARDCGEPALFGMPRAGVVSMSVRSWQGGRRGISSLSGMVVRLLMVAGPARGYGSIHILGRTHDRRQASAAPTRFAHPAMQTEIGSTARSRSAPRGLAGQDRHGLTYRRFAPRPVGCGQIDSA